jgi:hypothetical protein
MDQNNNHINYSASDIEKYWKGNLPASQMHAMEKAALEDPFLADALEGYRLVASKQMGADAPFEADITDLENRLRNRVSKKSETRILPIGWWKIAAIFIVVAGGIWLYTILNNNSQQTNIAQEKERAKKPADLPVQMDSSKSVVTKSDSEKESALAITPSHKPPIKTPGMPAFEEKNNKEPQSDSILPAAPVAAASSQKSINELKKSVDDKSAEKEQGLADIVINKPGAKQAPARSENAALSGKIKGISTEFKDKRIVQLKDDLETYAAHTFNGRLLNQSNQPIANANVQIPDLNIATRTDKHGNFSFKSTDTALNVTVASNDFVSQNQKLQNNQGYSSNQIILNAVPALQNQGYSRQAMNNQRKRAAQPSQNLTLQILNTAPVVDWKAYEKYIQENKEIPDDVKDVHGIVIVSFTVEAKGNPFNFSVDKSLDAQLDEEVIRLIKEGPAWKLLKGKSARGSLMVKF